MAFIGVDFRKTPVSCKLSGSGRSGAGNSATDGYRSNTDGEIFPETETPWRIARASSDPFPRVLADQDEAPDLFKRGDSNRGTHHLCLICASCGRKNSTLPPSACGKRERKSWDGLKSRSRTDTPSSATPNWESRTKLPTGSIPRLHTRADLPSIDRRTICTLSDLPSIDRRTICTLSNLPSIDRRTIRALSNLPSIDRRTIRALSDLPSSGRRAIRTREVRK